MRFAVAYAFLDQNTSSVPFLVQVMTQYIVGERCRKCGCCDGPTAAAKEQALMEWERTFGGANGLADDDERHRCDEKQDSDGEFVEVMMTRLDSIEKLLDGLRLW